MAFAGHLGVSLNVDLLVTEGDGIADSRAEYGDSKNWAQQVSARREELTLRALFNEELGAIVQVRDGAPRRGDADPARRRPEQAQPRRRQDQRRARSSRSGATPRRCSARRCATCTRPGTRSAGASAACATTPSAPTPSTRPPAAPTTRGCTSISPAPAFDPARPRAPAHRRQRAQGRGAARAGRQQPRRAQLRDERRPASRPTTST